MSCTQEPLGAPEHCLVINFLVVGATMDNITTSERQKGAVVRSLSWSYSVGCYNLILKNDRLSRADGLSHAHTCAEHAQDYSRTIISLRMEPVRRIERRKEIMSSPQATQNPKQTFSNLVISGRITECSWTLNVLPKLILETLEHYHKPWTWKPPRRGTTVNIYI